VSEILIQSITVFDELSILRDRRLYRRTYLHLRMQLSILLMILAEVGIAGKYGTR
jgi:hypothetical protein